MKAIVVEGPGRYGLTERPLPQPRPGWARVKVLMAAFCSTDLEVLSGGIKCRYPLTPGHEWCGLVDEVNGQSEQDQAWLGAYVCASNDVCCLVCPACRSGQWRNCPSFGEIGFAHDGAFAEYLLVPLYALRRLPEDFSPIQACLLEPLGVGVGTLDKLDARAGESLLIMGAGSIALNTLAVAKAWGLSPVVVMERSGRRLPIALEMGADQVLASSQSDAESELAKLLPGGPDLIVDTTGAEEPLQMALRIAPKSGRIALAGYASHRHFSLHIDDIHIKNLRLVGAGNNWNVLDRCIDLVKSGLVDTRRLATHRMRIEDFDEAVRLAKERLPGFVKTVFMMGDHLNERTGR